MLHHKQVHSNQHHGKRPHLNFENVLDRRYPKSSKNSNMILINDSNFCYLPALLQDDHQFVFLWLKSQHQWLLYIDWKIYGRQIVPLNLFYQHRYRLNII